MVVVAVDDESISLDCLSVVLSNTPQIDEVHSFSDPVETLEWVHGHKPDVAFLDVEMQKMSGLALAAKIRTICPTCNIIFVTSHQDYAVEAFKLRAKGYIMKPATREAVQEEINNICQPQSQPLNENSDKIKVVCFGNFDTYYNGNLIKFSLSKAKELFAYLVHKKGTEVSMGELAAVLFEDKADNESTQSQLRNLISEMKKSFAKAGVSQDIFEKSRGFIAIKTAFLECDYYDFLNAKTEAVNSYTGEYMSQYSWAEFTVGYLESLLDKFNNY